MELESINPSTDKLISTYATMTPKALSEAIEATYGACLASITLSGLTTIMMAG